jgi:Skp family chaperone for outer membrane proteins
MVLAPVLAAGVAAAVFAAPGGAPAAAPAAPGADSRPPRIAVVDPSRIFNEMKETKALNLRMQDEMVKFKQTLKDKDAEIDRIRKARDDMKPDHPQYEELNNQLLTAQAEAKVWLETQRVTNDQRQKRQTKRMFEKVQAAVAEIANQQKIDLVIADNKHSLPEGQKLEQTDIRALEAMILQKDVLYAGERLDISGQVLALLDGRFQPAGAPAAGGGAAPAGAVPAAARGKQ